MLSLLGNNLIILLLIVALRRLKRGRSAEDAREELSSRKARNDDAEARLHSLKLEPLYKPVTDLFLFRRYCLLFSHKPQCALVSNDRLLDLMA